MVCIVQEAKYSSTIRSYNMPQTSTGLPCFTLNIRAAELRIGTQLHMMPGSRSCHALTTNHHIDLQLKRGVISSELVGRRTRHVGIGIGC